MCLSVYSLLLMHGHSFERLCKKFGLWHPYTLQMVMGITERHSSSRASAQRASIGKRNRSSAVGA